MLSLQRMTIQREFFAQTALMAKSLVSKLPRSNEADRIQESEEVWAWSEPLQVGDLVAAAGVGSLQSDGKTPLLQVRRMTDSNPDEVIGVVKSAFRIETSLKTRTEFQEVEQSVEAGPQTTGGTQYVARTVEEQVHVLIPVDGPAQPGDLLAVQVQGLAQVRVSREAGSIQPGDLLATGPAGLVLRAEPFLTTDGKTYMYPAGTIIGKALEPWNGGDGLIWILIDLR